MNPQTIWELIGYFASLLVLISLLMTSVVKLRVINLVGSLIFAIYALAISSYPTAVMNFCLVGVNIYHLVRIKKTSKHFTMLPTELDSAYLLHFLQSYQEDIHTYFPEFDFQSSGADTAYFVYCDMAPAGLLMGRDLGDGTLEVALDYTTPQYRDCSVGHYLYSQLPDRGCRRLVTPACSGKHSAYLRKMGFAPAGGGGYTKELRAAQRV